MKNPDALTVSENEDRLVTESQIILEKRADSENFR